MVLHNSLHAGDGLVSHGVGVLNLVIQEGAASGLDAGSVALHTGLVGGVALNAGDLNALDLFPAALLGQLGSSLAAQLAGGLVAGTDEGQDLGGVNVSVDGHDGLGLALDHVGDHVGLQGSDDITVDVSVVHVGLDHVLLLIVSGLGGSALDLDLDIGMISHVSLSTGNNIAPILGGGGLQDNGDVILLLAGGGGLLGLRGFLSLGGGLGLAAAASGQRQGHSQSKDHGKVLFHFFFSPFRLISGCRGTLLFRAGKKTITATR